MTTQNVINAKQNQNQKGNQAKNQNPPTEAEMAKALGTSTVPEVKAPVSEVKVNPPAIVPAPESEETRLFNELKPERQAQVNSFKSMSPEDRLNLIKMMWHAEHPAGMVESFKKAMIEVAVKEAQRAGVPLVGNEILIRFPTTEGTEYNVEIAAVGTYKAGTKASGKGKGSDEKRAWGECTVTDDKGAVKAYDNPSAMAKGLGLRITGHTDQLHTFTSPKRAEGLDWEKNWKNKTITVTKGDLSHPEDGIHVKLS
jgi:hypothetical protein